MGLEVCREAEGTGRAAAGNGLDFSRVHVCPLGLSAGLWLVGLVVHWAGRDALSFSVSSR